MDVATSTPSVDTSVHTPSVDTSTPVIVPTAGMETPHRGGSVGSVIAILLIVFLLVIGAFYVWGQRLSEQRAQQYIPAVGQ